MAESKKFEWALPLGTTLHGSYPYEIVEYLGQGGFGITYKVKTRVHINNIGLEVFFAVKEYFPNSCWRGDDGITVQYSRALEADMKSGLSDFVTEGERLQSICKLNTNIVSVNEVFKANDTAYYVMEYLEGGNVRELVKKNGGGFSEAEMMSIMHPIAVAVQCLHENNMLHLDIKPENIVMRRNHDGRPDEPVLIDFGIAVHFDNNGNPTTKNPSAGVSPGYSPKEQYSTLRIFDPRLDIYALSATCFYMLTGKDPVDSLCMPLGFVRQELPHDLSDRTTNAIVRGMSLEMSDRQSSVKNFLMDFEAQHTLPIAEALEQNNTFHNTVQQGREEKKTNKSSSRKKWIVMVAAVALVIVTLGVVLFVLNYGSKYELEPNPGEKSTRTFNMTNQFHKKDAIDKRLTVDNKSCSYTGDLDDKDRCDDKNGVCIFDNGDKYEGALHNNMMHGEGEYRFVNGEWFKGTLVNNKFAKGKYYYTDGTYFEGDFKNDALFNGYVRRIKDNKKVCRYENGRKIDI